MSEYQYYEFQAIDRPLTDEEQKTLRRYSSRARITPTRFVNSYSYGDFRGDESQWMTKYFDAFLYMANWGTHRLMLRLPSSLFPESMKRYCTEDSFSARVAEDYVILDFRSDNEGGDDDWIEDDNDTLSSLVPIRSELAGGDLRAFYIAWLCGAQNGEFDDDDEEPPCPPGLSKLSAALEAFADFLRVDQDLIDAAATASPDLHTIDDDVLRRWVSTLSEKEKTELLVGLISGREAHLRAETLMRVRKSCAPKDPAANAKRRTVRELLEAAEHWAEERRRQEAERAAREKARREREEAAAREIRLGALAKREQEAWRQVDALIVTKQPKNYDEAITLLRDLRDLCVGTGRQAEAVARIARLQQAHASKPSLMKRFREAGLHT